MTNINSWFLREEGLIWNIYISKTVIKNLENSYLEFKVNFEKVVFEIREVRIRD